MRAFSVRVLGLFLRYFKYAHKHGDAKYEAGKAAWEVRQIIAKLQKK
jgi:hypothetical protein